MKPKIIHQKERPALGGGGKAPIKIIGQKQRPALGGGGKAPVKVTLQIR